MGALTQRACVGLYCYIPECQVHPVFICASKTRCVLYFSPPESILYASAVSEVRTYVMFLTDIYSKKTFSLNLSFFPDHCFFLTVLTDIKYDMTN